jgi:putative NADPH-quinone reductase
MHGRHAELRLPKHECMTNIWRMQLVILGHPASESFSDALGQAYVQGLRSSGAATEVLTLRALDFDPHLRAGFSGRQALEADLLAAQDLLQRAAHVAWFFPTWWGGPPALVKAFIDRAFLPGFAFKNRRGNSLPETLLKGRSSRVVTTMDSPAFWYQLWHRASLHTSFVNATLRYVGFGPVKTTTVYRLRELSAAQRGQWVNRLEALGRRDASAYQRRDAQLRA